LHHRSLAWAAFFISGLLFLFLNEKGEKGGDSSVS